MKRKIISIMAIAACLALSASASAEVITVKVEGVVNSISTKGGVAHDGSVSIGSAMTGYFTYDTDTPDQVNWEGSGIYEVISISMTVGNYTFRHNTISTYSPEFYISTGDPNPFYWVHTVASRFAGTIYIDGSPKTYEDINWGGGLTLMWLYTSSYEYIPTDALPDLDSWPELSVFDIRRAFQTRFYGEGDDYFGIYGEVTSLTVVPAPFEFTPAKVDFHYYLDDPNPEPQTLYIWAKEVDMLNWQIIEDCNWLDVSPTSGQSSGEVDDITLTLDISGLTPGSYHCQLAVFDPNISYYIRYVPVNLLIGTKRFVPSQYPTIQAAIDAADDYDTILVADGTYTGPGNRDIDFLGKAITVRSECGPENCIIDCNGTEEKPHRGFYFHSGEDKNSIADGFTITNGYGSRKFIEGHWLSCGGAILCNGSSPTIINFTISGNSATHGGGINCLEYSSPKITNCTISDNTTGVGWWESNGAGIFCYFYSRPIITNCTISGNLARRLGGGIYCESFSSPTITNCTIRDNTARYHGGISCCYDSNSTISNCTISGNKGGGIGCLESSLKITKCIISGNSAKYDGGGIYSEYGSLTITNCTINGNMTEGEGGGILCAVGNHTITNCSITGNRAVGAGGGIFNLVYSNLILTNCTISGNSAGLGGGGMFNTYYSSPTINNCIFRVNEAPDGPQIYLTYNSHPSVSYTDVQGGQNDVYISPDSTLDWGKGNIDADPCFVQLGYWDANGTSEELSDDFWVEGDYHLLPDSPCIDAGDPNYIAEANETDLDGNPRVRGDAIDMGAYETIIHEAHLLILPRVINRRSSKPRIMAWVHLPQGINRDQIDSDTPLILYPGGIEAMRQFVFDNRRRGAQRASIFAVFDKAELMDAIPANGRVQLQVLGHLRQPGQYFSGSDTIRIIPRPSKPQARRLHKLFSH